MPLYEYECTACHKHTEKIQKFSDPEITDCPHCGGPLKRVISAPAFSLKGGGWYSDLYSSPKPAAASGSSEASAPKSDAAPAAASAPTAPTAAPAPSAPAASSSSSDNK